MKKTFYLQIDERCQIRDVIEFPYEDYKKVELNTPLPYEIMGGAYKLINDEVVYVPEWDKNKLVEDVEELKNKLSSTSKMMDEMILNGMEEI